VKIVILKSKEFFLSPWAAAAKRIENVVDDEAKIKKQKYKWSNENWNQNMKS